MHIKEEFQRRLSRDFHHDLLCADWSNVRSIVERKKNSFADIALPVVDSHVLMRTMRIRNEVSDNKGIRPRRRAVFASQGHSSTKYK